MGASPGRRSRQPSHAASDHCTEGCSALAGLRTRGRTARPLLTDASQAGGPVLMTAFVPTYRCGAVPDFHRVPSYLAPPGLTARTSCSITICGRTHNPEDYMLGRRVACPMSVTAAYVPGAGVRRAGLSRASDPIAGVSTAVTSEGSSTPTPAGFPSARERTMIPLHGRRRARRLALVTATAVAMTSGLIGHWTTTAWSLATSDD